MSVGLECSVAVASPEGLNIGIWVAGSAELPASHKLPFHEFCLRSFSGIARKHGKRQCRRDRGSKQATSKHCVPPHWARPMTAARGRRAFMHEDQKAMPADGMGAAPK